MRRYRNKPYKIKPYKSYRRKPKKMKYFLIGLFIVVLGTIVLGYILPVKGIVPWKPLFIINTFEGFEKSHQIDEVIELYKPI